VCSGGGFEIPPRCFPPPPRGPLRRRDHEVGPGTRGDRIIAADPFIDAQDQVEVSRIRVGAGRADPVSPGVIELPVVAQDEVPGVRRGNRLFVVGDDRVATLAAQDDVDAGARGDAVIAAVELATVSTRPRVIGCRRAAARPQKRR